MTDESDTGDKKGIQHWFSKLTWSRLKKLGFYGFLFFFIKGLLWLIIPALVLYFGFGSD